MLSLKPRPFVHSSFNMQAFRYPHVFLSFFLFPFFCLFGDIAFSEYFSHVLRSESTSYVLSFRMLFFVPCDHGLDFLHQLIM